MRHVKPTSAGLGAALALILLPLAGQAAQSDAAADAAASPTDTVPAKWKPQEVKYSYVAFTTAYNCDAFESRMKRILLAVGAHPETKVRATGCFNNRPQLNFFVTITTATPVPASEPDNASRSKSEQELLDRLGVKDTFGKEQFAATWQTIDLGKDQKLDLEPGDCELMAGLVDEILPKLSVKVQSGKIQCIPKQLTIQTPALKVSALVRAPSADEPQPKT